jgi:N6-L-threonylcarbamoyladenine synthase
LPLTILAIESSCDETAASVCVDGNILSNVIASQSIHELYGGVVPELASRAHMQNIMPVVEQALKVASQNQHLPQHSLLTNPLTIHQMDAIAFTKAPGLIGSLLVGACFAKSLALALEKPLIGVHHMQAHVLANLIGDQKPNFPFLCLTVSGGHTQIVLCKTPYELRVIGETLDDAAGEAFDKSAKMLGLPYPGGPLIDKFASMGKPIFDFAEPRIEGLNFSFSGLKTSVLYFLQKQQKHNPDFIEENLTDLCASVQSRIISILINKLKRAVKETGLKEVCLAGGVSANSGLRNAFLNTGKQYNWKTYIPAFEYCTDNAGMIAITGYYKYLAGEFDDLSVSPTARAEW